MVLLELFWSFLKIGFTSFGGLSMIPSHQQRGDRPRLDDRQRGVRHCGHRRDDPPAPWASTAPPSRAFRRRAFPGPIAANLGVMSPTLTLCAAAAVFFERVKGNKYMEHILVGGPPRLSGDDRGGDVLPAHQLPGVLRPGEPAGGGHRGAGSGIAPEGKAERPGGHRDQRPAGAAVLRGFGLAVARPAWYNGRRQNSLRQEADDMVPSYETMGDWLEEISQKFPDAFF